MKIVQFQLKAFGPFSGEAVDLGEGREGLHLIFGPNEAGKSSALRAVRGLLYGIPGQTPDNFLHPYGSLRIGAVLRHSDGSTLSVLRRKGTTKTLRGPDDRAVIDDRELDRFLGGVDAELFQAMFGIDHVRLQQGGEEILRGGGRLGELLFSTGAGIADLRATQEHLQSDMDALFKPNGRKPQINQAIHGLKEARAAVKHAQLSVEEWRRHDSQLDEAQEEKRRVDEELREKQGWHARLVRIRDALPAISQWKSAQRELEQYADAPLLPDDFSRKYVDAQIRLKRAEQQQDDAQSEIGKLRDQLKDLQIPHELLAEGETIDELHTRLGSQRKATHDLPGLETARKIAEREATEILRRLGQSPHLEEVESLRLADDVVVHIQNLANQREALVERVDASRKECERHERNIARYERETTEPGSVTDPGPLQKTVRRIQHRCEAQERLASLAAEVEQAAATAEALLARLPLWNGTLEELEKLPVPSETTIERLEEEIRERERVLETSRKEKQSLVGDLRQLSTQLESLDREGDVPTEADLTRARHLRDQGWHWVLADWQAGHADRRGVEEFMKQFPPVADLAAAYRTSVERADHLADRLRREAGRVAAKARWQAESEQQSAQIDAADRRIAAAEKELEAANTEWRQLWAALGITPQSPKEMRAWLRNQQALAGHSADLRAKRAEIRRLAEQVDVDRQCLSQMLVQYGQSPAAPDESLSELIQRGQDVLDELQELRTRERQLHERLASDRAELEEWQSNHERARTDMGRWQAEWAVAMQRLRLNEGATPAQANTALATLNQLFLKYQEADQLRLRIEGIHEDARQFEAAARYVVRRVAPEWADEPAERIVERLVARLQDAKALRARHESLRNQRDAHAEKLRHTREAITAVDAELRAMCHQAGCETVEGFPAAQKRAQRRRELEAKLRDLEEQLGPFTGGKELTEFVAEVEAEVAGVGELEPRIHDLRAEVDRLTARREDLIRSIEREQNELARMDGSAAASEKADECENLVTRLEEQLHELAILRIASAVLRGGIERYREKNQGPLLDRAGQLFARLTQGSFESLRADFDDQGEPVLTGVRPGGAAVGVQGMSDGTRDQLFLALRIASLEAWLENHEPIPFIVDDILLNFDDDRATAALSALGHLARSTQVIFFTHHRHLVELAQNRLPEDALFVHHLTSRAAINGHLP